MEDQDNKLEKTETTETTPDDTNVPIINIDNLSMRQLMELDACTRCGECSLWCPAYEQDKKEGITPRGRAKAFKDIIKAQHNVSLSRRWISKAKEYGFYLIMHEHLFVFRKPSCDENLSRYRWSRIPHGKKNILEYNTFAN